MLRVRCADGGPCASGSARAVAFENRGALGPLWPLASVPPPIGLLPIATPSGFPIPDIALRSGWTFGARLHTPDSALVWRADRSRRPYRSGGLRLLVCFAKSATTLWRVTRLGCTARPSTAVWPAESAKPHNADRLWAWPVRCTQHKRLEPRAVTRREEVDSRRYYIAIQSIAAVIFRTREAR